MSRPTGTGGCSRIWNNDAAQGGGGWCVRDRWIPGCGWMTKGSPRGSHRSLGHGNRSPYVARGTLQVGLGPAWRGRGQLASPGGPRGIPDVPAEGRQGGLNRRETGDHARATGGSGLQELEPKAVTPPPALGSRPAHRRWTWGPLRSRTRREYIHVVLSCRFDICSSSSRKQTPGDGTFRAPLRKALGWLDRLGPRPRPSLAADRGRGSRASEPRLRSRRGRCRKVAAGALGTLPIPKRQLRADQLSSRSWRTRGPVAGAGPAGPGAGGCPGEDKAPREM